MVIISNVFTCINKVLCVTTSCLFATVKCKSRCVPSKSDNALQKGRYLSSCA